MCKPPKSRDFIALKALVIPLRPESYRIRRDTAVFGAIARLVNDAQCDNPESIHDTLLEVEKIVLQNVEENNGN